MRKILTWLVMVGVLVSNGNVLAKSAHKNHLKTLTLHDAILLAVRNNPQVRSARLQRVVDKFALEVARNEFLPQFKFTASGHVVDGQNPDVSANPKITLKTGIGTTFEAGLTGSYYDGTDSERFTASMRQPLLRGFGSTVTMAGWCNALDTEQVNQLIFKDKLQSTVTKVIKAYYKLVEDYNRLDVENLALQDSLQSLKSIKLKIKAGKIAPMEATQQEAQVANQRYTITQNQNTIDRDYQELLVMLGLDPNSQIQIVRTIPQDKIVVPNRDQSIERALRNNIGFIRELISLKEKKRAVLVAQDDQRWKLDLTASINQDLKRENNVGIYDFSSSGFRDDKRVGLELSIPIHDLANQKKLVDAKMGLRKFLLALDNEKRLLITNVVNAIRDLKAQQAQIDSAQRAVDLSIKSLHIAQRKFDYGRTTLFEITSLRKSLTQRQQALIQQRIAYLTTLAQFEETLGVTLSKWHLSMNGS